MRNECFLIWTNLNLLHPRMHCAKWFWRGFLNFSLYLGYFVIISPWKRAGPFNWTNLNPRYPRMICAKFSWNWPSGSGQEDFVLESPLPKDALCQIWLKLAQWFLKRRWKFERWSEKLTWAFSSGELKSVFLAASCQYFIRFLQGHKSTKVSFLSICKHVQCKCSCRFVFLILLRPSLGCICPIYLGQLERNIEGLSFYICVVWVKHNMLWINLEFSCNIKTPWLVLKHVFLKWVPDILD